MVRFNRMFLMGLVMITISCAAKGENDPYAWLEEVEGQRALEWVKERNDISTKELEAVPGYREAYETILTVMDAKDRIPYPGRQGNTLYNFWKDAEHPRGILRRTTLAEYRKAEPAWETVLDIDALCRAEGKNWVYKGASFLYPRYDRCLISLSRGGADAVEVREFDAVTKTFVKNGFFLPEAKSEVAWKDRDALYVATDFGPGTMTASGYPRIVKLWRRGTPLDEARTVYEGKPDGMAAHGFRMFQRQGNVDFVQENTDFYHSEKYILHRGRLVRLAVPADAQVAGLFEGRMLFSLKSDWTTGGKTFRQGSVVLAPIKGLLTGKPSFELLIEPGPSASVEGVDVTRNRILVTLLDNVVNRIVEYRLGENGQWKSAPVPAEGLGTFHIMGTEETDDDYFLSYNDFLTPPSLYFVSAATGKPELLKSLPAVFDASPYTAVQRMAVSKDGTKVPYFMVSRKDMALDGRNPTLINAYGGFEVSETPYYLSSAGKVWLEKGGVLVLANLRGGGEFGPRWHLEAIQRNRHKVYEDMIAVSEDLIRQKVTSPGKLAIRGGSNGGLMVGAVAMMRPDLYKAVVCMVPLLDMKRYTKLLAGHSWMAEYGDPDDPDMWAYMKDYSPYHMARKEATYPRIFFTTSTRDDRVHPGHARKMTALLLGMGHDCLYWENMEGGHAGAADNKQAARMSALCYAYLYKLLMPAR